MDEWDLLFIWKFEERVVTTHRRGWQYLDFDQLRPKGEPQLERNLVYYFNWLKQNVDLSKAKSLIPFTMIFLN